MSGARLPFWPRTQQGAGRAVLGLSVALSLGAILVAAWLDKPGLGGLGGAFGVALSFLILFAGRDSAGRAFEEERDGALVVAQAHAPYAGRWPPAGGATPPAGDLGARVERLEAELAGLRRSLDDWAPGADRALAADREVAGVLVSTVSPMLGAARRERRFLTWSSVVSTLAWATGDFVAGWLAHWL